MLFLEHWDHDQVISDCFDTLVSKSWRSVWPRLNLAKKSVFNLCEWSQSEVIEQLHVFNRALNVLHLCKSTYVKNY